MESQYSLIESIKAFPLNLVITSPVVSEILINTEETLDKSSLLIRFIISFIIGLTKAQLSIKTTS